MAVNPKSLKNLKQGPPTPKGNQYATMAAQRRARIQQLCTMEPNQLAAMKRRTIYDQMIITMLRSKSAKDHELIMKADAPGLLRDELAISGDVGIVVKKIGIDVDEL